MPTSSEPRILFLGASGYVGGTCLHYLLKSSHPVLSKITFTALIRGDDRAQKLKVVYGDRVNPIVYSGLDDTDLISSLAAEHDIVLNLGMGFHVASAEAMVRGLARRLANKDLPKPWMIQISGVTNHADSPLFGDNHPERHFDDADPLAIYEFQKALEAERPYPQRAAQLAVLDAAEETGVNALSLQGPAFWGQGRGLFLTSPAVLPLRYAFLLNKGYGFQLGDGTSCIGVVHVDDFSELVVLITEKILDDGGKDLPRGKKGIMFAEVGTLHNQRVMQSCLDAAFRNGVLPKPGGPQQKEVRVIDIDEAAEIYGGGPPGRMVASQGGAGHMNETATTAMRLGWKPQYSAEDFYSDAHFDEELKATMTGQWQGVATH